MSAASILDVCGLEVGYVAGGRSFRAVDDVSFSIGSNETVGLVGESGCGKSSLGKTIIRLLRPTAGSVTIDGQDITGLKDRDLLPIRRKVQMVFQDPYGSLNPRQTIRTILERPLIVHGVRDQGTRLDRVRAMLDTIGIPATMADRYPHQFSGGQRQRIGIARALILHPKLIIWDEPVSALDLSIQAQILNLMVDLKSAFGLAYLFISHDLSVVRYIADRVLVMYMGRIVEIANHQTLWQRPQHPYSRLLLKAVPGARHRGMPVLVPSLDANVPDLSMGCRFRDRCEFVTDRCHIDDPQLRWLPDGRAVACHHV